MMSKEKLAELVKLAQDLVEATRKSYIQNGGTESVDAFVQSVGLCNLLELHKMLSE